MKNKTVHAYRKSLSKVEQAEAWGSKKLAVGSRIRIARRVELSVHGLEEDNIKY